jgi:hypothetical protein
MIVNIIYSTIQHPHAFDSKKNHHKKLVIPKINYFLLHETLLIIQYLYVFNSKKHHQQKLIKK